GVDRRSDRHVVGDAIGYRLVHVLELLEPLIEVVAGDDRAQFGELGRGRVVHRPHDHRIGGVDEQVAVEHREPGEIARPQAGDYQPPLVVSGVVLAGVVLDGAEPGAVVPGVDGGVAPGGCTIGWGSTTHVPYPSLTVTSASRSFSPSQPSIATAWLCRVSCSRISSSVGSSSGAGPVRS